MFVCRSFSRSNSNMLVSYISFVFTVIIGVLSGADSELEEIKYEPMKEVKMQNDKDSEEPSMEKSYGDIPWSYELIKTYKDKNGNENFEERKYDPHQKICASEDVPDVSPDVSETVEDWDKRQGLHSFQLGKLDAYLHGKNKDNAQVGLSGYPVQIHVFPHNNGTVTRTMCHWLKIDDSTPQPLDPQLRVSHYVPEITVFTRSIQGDLNEAAYRNEARTLMRQLMAAGLEDVVDFSSYCIFISDSQD